VDLFINEVIVLVTSTSFVGAIKKKLINWTFVADVVGFCDVSKGKI